MSLMLMFLIGQVYLERGTESYGPLILEEGSPIEIDGKIYLVRIKTDSPKEAALKWRIIQKGKMDALTDHSTKKILKGNYIWFTGTVTNLSEDIKYVDDRVFKIIDIEGKPHEADVPYTMYPRNSKYLHEKELYPEESTSFVIFFRLHSDVVPKLLNIDGQIWNLR